MHRAEMWLIAFILVVGGVWYIWQPGSQAPDTEPERELAIPKDTEPEPNGTDEPGIRHPIPEPELPDEPPDEPPAEAPDEPAPPEPRDEEPPRHPLPDLEESDAPLVQALDRIVDQETLRELFHVDRIVRRVVLTVDNLARNRLSLEKRIANPVAGRLRVREDDDVIYLDASNDSRYAPYVRLAETVDVDKLVALYVRYYPLFQQAYEELGYPDRYFNDRLVDVIDHLLATPEVERPIRLKRPHVLYEFADPELEDLSPGRKILIRMGRRNAERIKARLRDLRDEITAVRTPPAR